MSKLAIVLFTTTKGHYGRKDLYKFTVNNLLNRLFEINYQLFAHIKYGDGEENQVLEMSNWLQEKGAKILLSKGDWSHHSKSHAEEYTKDITRAFLDSRINEYQFSLFQEDDFCLTGSVTKFLYEGIRILQKYPHILSVRANHGPETPEENKIVKMREDDFFKQGKNYTPWGPTFTFQPTVVRTRDMMQAYRLIRDNWEKLKNNHIELTSGMALKTLSDDPLPFCFIDPKVCHSIHIGEEPFEMRLLEKEKYYNY